MTYFIRGFIQLFICFALVLTVTKVNAQTCLVKNTIDKIESYKNYSYRSVSKEKELFTSDTVKEQHKASFAKAPEDKNFGYLFNIESKNEKDEFTYADLYNGQNLIHITPEDSTYEMQQIQVFNTQGTLQGCLKWICDRLEKRSSKIVKNPDTIINAVNCNYLIAHVYDTIIDKERNYTDAYLFISKLSGMPDCIIIKSRNTTYGEGVSNYYSERRYFDYQFDQDNIDIASMPILMGLHSPKKKPVLSKDQTSLLSLGSLAPDWSLYAADGKKMSLSQMKGKVVVMDFFFIGCDGCMLSLKPLNKIHEKYKNQNVAIASITERDSKKSVLEFEKNYKIKYSCYVNASDVVKSYHVEGFPTYYFIDKEGKIANIFVGYTDDLEAKLSSIVNNLLKR